MKIARLRQPALSAVAVLLISGAGIAFAGTPSPAVPAAAPVVQAAGPAVEPVQPAGADTDTLQEGDQTTPDSPATGAEATGAEAVGTEAAGAEAVGTESVAAEAADAEAAGTEAAGAEKAGAEAPGDANLPGGGHADDSNNANADHQFEGVE